MVDNNGCSGMLSEYEEGDWKELEKVLGILLFLGIVMM